MSDVQPETYSYCVGKHSPLGVLREGKAYNFAVAVPGASKCVLKLTHAGKTTEIVMNDDFRFGAVFAVKVDGIKGDFTYCYNAFDKDFADPYARGLVGHEKFGADNSSTPECRFVADSFDWKGDKALKYRLDELIIYKLHVRGFTMDESSGVKHKGTFLGIEEKLPYIKKLGVNCLLLMPCTEFEECMKQETKIPAYVPVFEKKNVTDKKSDIYSKPEINYWGYGAKGAMFAPKASFAADSKHPDRELKHLIRKLHSQGIEVMMELAFPEKSTPGFVSDVCRFWVEEYHIDGFRFINMPVSDYVISGNPYLADTVLIGPGWDEQRVYGRDDIPAFKNLAVMDDNFPSTVRRFLKGDEGVVNGFAEMLRRNSLRVGFINSITDCNGFTLNDLYSYDVKHNELNGENNRDGAEINHSWNCGKEGETAGKKIKTLRFSMIKNALTALFMSQGTPLLLAGDEFMNSQQGNNNAYCQDNPISWLNWNKSKQAKELTAFTAELIAARKEHPVLRNKEPLRLMDYVSYGCPDVSYHGTSAWGPDFAYHSHCIGMLLNGDYFRFRNGKSDKSFYVLFNSHWEEHDFDLPLVKKNTKWKLLFAGAALKDLSVGDSVERKISLPARCAIVLTEV